MHRGGGGAGAAAAAGQPGLFAKPTTSLDGKEWSVKAGAARLSRIAEAMDRLHKDHVERSSSGGGEGWYPAAAPPPSDDRWVLCARPCKGECIYVR
jgi:hypothetical protein